MIMTPQTQLAQITEMISAADPSHNNIGDTNSDITFTDMDYQLADVQEQDGLWGGFRQDIDPAETLRIVFHNTIN